MHTFLYGSAAPLLPASYGSPGEDVSVVDGLAYVADYGSGLHIIDLSGCPPCYADLDGSGALDLFDIAYVNAFNTGDPIADGDQNGVLDLFDFLQFVNAFNEGCP